MTKVQPKIGWHVGAGGGNLSGITSDYIIPVLAAGKNITIVAADTAAGLYDACVAAKNYQNTGSVLCYRTTDKRSQGGFDFDALANNFSISPEENAALHWAAFEPTIPNELRPYKNILELIILNEIRSKQTDEPIYQGLHIGEYLGRFALHYRTLTDWRLLFFGFASGEPEPDLWEQPSMLQLLRLCGERPHDTGLATHEYSYNVNDIFDGYPYLIGRFRALYDICDIHGIAWPRVVISEWGWTLDNVPEPTKALADIDLVFRNEYAPFAQIAGAAIWWLGPGFGGIADKAQRLIKPVGDYIVSTLFDVTIEQPQPPDGGGGDMIETNVGKSMTERRAGATHARLVWFKEEPGTPGVINRVWLGQSDPMPIATGANIVAAVQYVIEEEPGNPNPPPVVMTLPQGSKGVDLSNYQAGFFEQVDSDESDFYIFRAFDGMNTSATSTNHDANGVDKSLWKFADVGHASGKPWGVYPFLRPGNIPGQIDKMLLIYQQLVDRGTPPRTAVFDDGKPFVAIWPDVEDWSLTNSLVKQFCDGVEAITETGIYTRKNIWDALTAGATNWWGNKPSWIAAYGSPNDGTIPPWPDGPFVPNGWPSVNIWQYSSEGQNVTDWTGSGLDMNIIGPYPPADKPDIPPPAQTYDLLPYMRGTHKQQHTLQYTWAGGGTQTVQNVHGGNEFKIVKGGAGEYEQLYYDDAWIYRAEDTSESQERFYTHSTNGTLGAAWVKRHMAVGETVYTSKQVQHYLKAGCSPQNGGLVTDKLTLAAVYPTYTFTSGLTLPDVIRLEWSAGEGYLFAKGYGLVGFEFSGGKSYISELALQGRADLPIEVPGCIDLSGRYYV